MTPLAYSTAWLRGMRTGYRLAGRSLPRRMLGTLLVGAVIWGTGLALTWEMADRLSKMATGEPVSIVVLSKVQSWLRIHPR